MFFIPCNSKTREVLNYIRFLYRQLWTITCLLDNVVRLEESSETVLSVTENVRDDLVDRLHVARHELAAAYEDLAVRVKFGSHIVYEERVWQGRDPESIALDFLDASSGDSLSDAIEEHGRPEWSLVRLVFYGDTTNSSPAEIPELKYPPEAPIPYIDEPR